MTKRPSSRPSQAATPTYVLIGTWSVTLLIVGGAFTGATWAPVCIGAGLLSLAAGGLGAARRSWVLALFGTLIVTAAGTIVGGAMLGQTMLIAAGVISLTVVGASVALLFGLRDLAVGSVTAPVVDHDLLRQIHEHTMLSDNAKRVLFRERELGLLRHAIEDDIGQGKYNAALTLCDELADVFGYREEAESFRGNILQARQERYDHDVAAALARLDTLLAHRDWKMGHQEAARIRRLYGDSHLVQDLDHRILVARDEHKRELEAEFLEAARRDDVEAAMALLKQLDRYLGPDEAERLTEVAQGVVVRHRENLGVQFKLAVNDHRWAEAARIGDAIVDEFPNTKMAGEVRSMIDHLRTRASQTVLNGPDDA